MPNSNNRKSREDKSFNNNRFDANSKNERQDRPNAENKRKFDGDRKKSFGDRPARPERPSSDERGQERRTSGDRPFAKKPFSQDSREKSRDSRAGGERSSERRSFGGDKREGFSGSRPQGDRTFEKKPFERRPFGDDKRGGEKKSFDRRPFGEDKRSGAAGSRPQSDRPFERKPFGSDRKPFAEDKRERRPYGDERKPGRPSDRPQSDRPYEKKPFRADERRSVDRRPADRRTDTGENRNWTSEEHVGKPNLRLRKKTTAPSTNSDLIRLNRYIANAGICSRRKADELIEAGVISVNGESITELGHKVNPMKDVIRYNGETLKREKMTYVLLNKPKDYITTTEDPQERRTVMQLVEKASKERIYPIGRLDRNTTGLLLMTNDGDLADKLSHPRNNVTKIYQVELNKSLSQGDLNKIAFGLELEDGLIKVDEISYVAGGSKKEVGVQIHSGKNRIVRRIFEHLGYEVVKLDRVVYANLTKKDLPRGRWRYLDEKEIIQLKHLIK